MSSDKKQINNVLQDVIKFKNTLDREYSDFIKTSKNNNAFKNALSSITTTGQLYTQYKNLATTGQVQQVQEYAISSSLEGSFELHLNGVPMKLDPANGWIRRNTGTPITFGIFDATTIFNNSQGRVCLYDTASNKALRQSNNVLSTSTNVPYNWEFAWFFHRTAAGGNTYELYSDNGGVQGRFVITYDASLDRFQLGNYDSNSRARFTISGTIPQKYLNPNVNALYTRFCRNLYFNDVPSSIATYTNPSNTFETTCRRVSSLFDATSGKVQPNIENNYTVEIKGYFRPFATGNWTFFLNTNDASYMWIGPTAESGFTTSNALIKNPGTRANLFEVSASTQLTSGVYYYIRIIAGDSSGGDDIIFSYTPPGGIKTTAGNLFYLNPPA